MTPILEDGPIRLVPFGSQYLTSRYVGWLNDPATMRYSENRHYVHTLESCQDYFRSMKRDKNYFWAILDRESHIGNVTAHIDYPNRVADIGILVGEASARGHGAGYRAWRLACDFLLKEAGMRKVTAGTMSENRPMLKIMRSIGMVEEGRRIGQFLLDGKEADLIMAALFTPPDR